VSIATTAPTPLAEHCPDLPKPLVDAVMRALEKRPVDRFASVAELAEAIAPFAAKGVAVHATAPRTPSIPDDGVAPRSEQPTRSLPRGAMDLSHAPSTVTGETAAPATGRAPRSRSFALALAGAALVATIAGAALLTRTRAPDVAPNAATTAVASESAPAPEPSPASAPASAPEPASASASASPSASAPAPARTPAPRVALPAPSPSPAAPPPIATAVPAPSAPATPDNPLKKRH
jgi:hypothetical protein